MQGHWTERSLVISPAVVEEESADTVTGVLVAAEGFEGMVQTGPAGVGCVLVAAEEPETVPVVAVRKAAEEAPVWILGSWTGAVIQGEPGNLAAEGLDQVGLAVVHRETGQTVGQKLEDKVAETEGALVMGQTVALGTVGPCGAVDRVVLLGHEEQKKVEGGVVLGKVSGLVVQVEVGSRGFAADLGGVPGQAGHNMEPGPESHSLLVPVVHKIPSVDHMACHPCLQGYALAFPPGIAGDLQGHKPDQGNQVPVVNLWEAPAVIADRMDSLLRMVEFSSSPLDPWHRVAGF